MEITFFSLLLPIISAAVIVALTFYLKEYLQKRAELSKLRKKLEDIAGKNSTIVYSPGPGVAPGIGAQLFKIIDTDQHGVTLKNELQEIFVPAAKLIQSDIILPCDEYDKARIAKVKKDMEEFADAIVPAMFKKMIPAIKEVVAEEFLDEGGEFGAIIGIKIEKALQDSGYEVRKVKSEDIPKTDNKE